MPTATAQGKTFNFPEGTTPEQMGVAIDEYFQNAANSPSSAQQEADSVSSIPDNAIPTLGINGMDREILQGITFGFADEIEAGLGATLAKFLDGADYDQAYGDIISSIRDSRDRFNEKHPAASIAGNVAGGLATGGAGIAKAISSTAKPLGKFGAAALTGAVEGGVAGAGTADGDDLKESIRDGAVMGAASAGVVGAAAGLFAKRSQLKDKIAEMMSKDPQNIKVAKYIQNGKGKIKKDRLAGEAIKQGYDEGVIAAIKGSSRADKNKMQKMIANLEKGKSNARFAATNRPSDIVGDSIYQRVKYIADANRQAGNQVERAANGLKGQQVDFYPAVNNFLKKLDDIGVDFNPARGTVSFEGSDFEKIPGAERAITNILDRMRNTREPDAYDVHRLKKFIDNHVEFGKTSDGSVGQAERMLKKLRHDMDAALDGKFKGYDQANTKFSQTKSALDDIQSVAGSTIDFSSNNLDKSLGTLSRRVMSNAQSRGRVLDAIQVLDDVASANGAKFEDDIITQVMFAGELDSVFGSSARNSFAGEIEKSIKTAATSRVDGGASAAISYAAKKAGQLRGINEENAIKVMKGLLSR